MVESIEVPDDHTLVFNLKYPSGAFIPALAAPFNFVYAKKDLEREDPEGKDPLYGMKWHQTNINGTGAFKFVQHQPGAFVEGARYDGYHHEGKPYLDGFKAIAAPKTAVRINAIRGDQAAIEFRGFAPKQRDDLVAALGDQITVQESDWNCQLLISINHKKAPFDDVRVRQALMHAVDRWSASEPLSQVAIVKTVGGIVFPSHGFAIRPGDPQELRRLLAGHREGDGRRRSGSSRRRGREPHLRSPQPLDGHALPVPRHLAHRRMEEDRRRGGPEGGPAKEWYAKHRAGTHDLGIDANCQSVINPVADVGKYTSHGAYGDHAGNPANYSHYEDEELDAMHARLLRSGDPAEQAEIMRAFEKRVLNDEARYGMTLWWNKINPHRSYVKGWKIAPSHYLNQHLDQVWIDKG